MFISLSLSLCAASCHTLACGTPMSPRSSLPQPAPVPHTNPSWSHLLCPSDPIVGAPPLAIKPRNRDGGVAVGYLEQWDSRCLPMQHRALVNSRHGLDAQCHTACRPLGPAGLGLLASSSSSSLLPYPRTPPISLPLWISPGTNSSASLQGWIA